MVDPHMNKPDPALDPYGHHPHIDRKIAESLQHLFVTINAGDSQRHAILDLIRSLLDERQCGHVIPRDYPPSAFMLEEKKMRHAFLPPAHGPYDPNHHHNPFHQIDYLKPTANVEDLIDTVNRILQILKAN